MKRSMTAFLILPVLLVCFVGCGQRSMLDPKDPVTLTMWHNYGGDMQQTMDYLIDQFNSTVGRDAGIIIDVAAISSGAELDKSLTMIANGDPGAPDMPDIFTGYPKIAVQLYEKDMLARLDAYFTEEELSAYVDAFVAEGRLSDGGLYVFPIAKSTEVLYVNQTLFDRFAEETGASAELLTSFEGIAELSGKYYAWSGGKQFFAADAWFHVFEVGMEQLGDSLFRDGIPAPQGNRFSHIFETIYIPAAAGGIAVYDGYSSDLSKTGDLVCSTGSSAGILFYGDTVTHADGTVEPVEYSILPYPVFEGGDKIALQRGGGLMVAKSEERKEYAASIFIKWLTASEQNLRFVSDTGYLPVTKQAFERDLPAQMETMEDPRIRKMLTSVLDMYEDYAFFTAPTYAGFDSDSDAFETRFKKLLSDAQTAYAKGAFLSAAEALKQFQS